MYQRDIVLYSRNRSFRCWRAKRFLRHQGYQFEIVDTTSDPNLLTELSDTIRRKVMPPYIFVDNRPVGNFAVVRDLSQSGGFDHLLRGKL